MSIWRLVGASSHTVAYGMRRLSGIPALSNTRADQAIQLRQAGAIFGEGRASLNTFSSKSSNL